MYMRRITLKWRTRPSLHQNNWEKKDASNGNMVYLSMSGVRRFGRARVCCVDKPCVGGYLISPTSLYIVFVLIIPTSITLVQRALCSGTVRYTYAGCRRCYGNACGISMAFKALRDRPWCALGKTLSIAPYLARIDEAFNYNLRSRNKLSHFD